MVRDLDVNINKDITISKPVGTPSSPPLAKQEGSNILDKFGVKNLFPTKGREWYINMNNPESDGFFDMRNGTVVSRNDGSWYTEGGVRLYVYSPAPQALWKNVEITGYFKSENTKSNLLQTYARGGIHTEQQYTLSNGTKKWGMCMGSAYKGRAYSTGQSSFVKEVGHSVYSDNHKGTKTGQFTNYCTNRRWFGIKFVIHEVNNPTTGAENTRMRLYIDDNAQNSTGNCTPKNQWKLMSDYTDVGDWNCDDGSTASNVETMTGLIDKCGLPPGLTREQYGKMIINWYGHPTFINDTNNRKIANCVSWRWDSTPGFRFKFLSAREIDVTMTTGI